MGNKIIREKLMKLPKSSRWDDKNMNQMVVIQGINE